MVFLQNCLAMNNPHIRACKWFIIFFIVIASSFASYGFELVDIDGRTHQKQNATGKFLIVNFFATWCPPCLKEIPLLVELLDTNATEVQILGIDFWDGVSDEALRDFIDLYFINYPVIRDNNNKNTFSYFREIRGLPTTFIYDKKNNLIKKIEGELTRESLREILELSSNF